MEKLETPAEEAIDEEGVRARYLESKAANELTEEEALELEIWQEKEELQALRDQKEKLVSSSSSEAEVIPNKVEAIEAGEDDDDDDDDNVDNVWHALQRKQKLLAESKETVPVEEEDLGNVSDAERNLQALQQELQAFQEDIASDGARGPEVAQKQSPPKITNQAIVEEIEVEAENTGRIIEAPPPKDDRRSGRRSRSNSASLMLAAAPSFGSSPQSELAASPMLKRAVHRSRPVMAMKPLPEPDSDEDNDGEMTDDGGLEGMMRDSRRSLSQSLDDESLPMLPPKSPTLAAAGAVAAAAMREQVQREFGSAANDYKQWVDEAIDDMAFRDFGDSLEEVLLFKEMLDESDKDIMEPNEKQYLSIMRSWHEVSEAQATDAEPYTSLNMEGIEELFASVSREMQARRSAYDARVAEMESERDDVAKEIRARNDDEAEAKQRPISIDFDITNELSSLDFDAVIGIVPDKPENGKVASVSSSKATLVDSEPLEEPLPPITTTMKAFEKDDIIEAIWDEDGKWYKARIDDTTPFGFWITFTSYGNSQDTQAGSMRRLSIEDAVSAKGTPAQAPSDPKRSPRNKKGLKKVLKKVKKKRHSGASDRGSDIVPSKVRSPRDEPPAEDVRAPVGGIKARMAQLALEQEAKEERKQKRLSGLEDRQQNFGTAASKVDAVLSKDQTDESVSRGNDDEIDDNDGAESCEDDEDGDEDEDGSLKIPVVLKQEDEENVVEEMAQVEIEEAEVASPAPVSRVSERVAKVAAMSASIAANQKATMKKQEPAKEVVEEVATPEADTSGMSESELKMHKLKMLREQLKKDRESGVSGSSGSMSSSRSAISATPPAARKGAGNGKKSPVAPFESMTGLDGVEPHPVVHTAEEILAAATTAPRLLAPGELRDPVELPARDKKRYEAVVALIESEREYYQQLSVIVALFLFPLQEAGILSATDCEELFGNVETIWGVHKLFLRALTAAASDWTTETSIVSVLDSFAPVFKMYNFYTAHVGKAMVAVTRFKTKHERGKDFKSHLSQAEANDACQGSNLRSLLNVPVRRPGMYPPLVRAIQKATNKNQPDFSALDTVISILERK